MTATLHRHDKKGSPFAALVVAFIFLAVLIGLAFALGEQAAPVLKTFSLTVQDLQMILVFCAIFPFLLWLIGSGLIRPYLVVAEAREAATSGAQEAAAELRQKADAIMAEFEERLTEARVASLQEKFSAVNRAKEAAHTEIQRAEAESRRIVQNARVATADETTALRNQLRRQIDELAGGLVEKVKLLGRSGT